MTQKYKHSLTQQYPMQGIFNTMIVDY